jgi:hypothetical protein
MFILFLFFIFFGVLTRIQFAMMSVFKVLANGGPINKRYMHFLAMTGEMMD